MADEARISITFQVKKGNLDYVSRPNAYTADVSVGRGPVPGAVDVTTSGTEVELPGLLAPGLVWVQNLDSTNAVEWGVWDGANFRRVGRLLAGEFCLFRFSSLLNATGASDTFYMIAEGATCTVLVQAFDS